MIIVVIIINFREIILAESRKPIVIGLICWKLINRWVYGHFYFEFCRNLGDMITGHRDFRFLFIWKPLYKLREEIFT